MTTQPGKQHDLHGSTPDSHHTALLLIDVINDFEFERGEELFRAALAIAPNLVDLKRRAQEAGMPVIYINDNFGRWKSNFDQVVEHCLEPGCKGRPFVGQLLPSQNDYSVLKPKHSAFYQTPLDLLLKHLRCQRVILSGFSTNSCVLFTANDAYMRDLEIVVPQNCVAACNAEDHQFGLKQMEFMLKADISLHTELDYASIEHDSGHKGSLRGSPKL